MSLRIPTLPAESLGGSEALPIEEEDRREDVVIGCKQPRRSNGRDPKVLRELANVIARALYHL